MAEELRSEVRGSVLTLTINRPERRNAMNPAVVQGLREAIVGANRDGAIRAIVITGVGEQAFCAGADLQSGKSFAFDYSDPYLGLADLLRVARQSTIPLIARVNGACMAGGMGLMAMCDMAVARGNAIFGLPEVKVGLFPAQVLSVLQSLVPRRLLNEMCLCGEPITAADALAAGLVNYVDDDLDGRIDWLLGRLLDKSPTAIRRGLYTIKHVEDMPFAQSMAFTESQIGLLAMTEDAREGQLAFREKRRPGWTGK
ncbi:enoyl-CoA hydratase/isomerase family protein [Cupriavidus metallidurans]|uniref:enoyl-CoA hydratase/isomerase family protein n=1 Tax=Cupriavidus metallidurans TaxID=119219 RepID=UPI001CCF1CCD|nr:enoyl-CoA hydratase/isomerase family protein [Cupriavidus metallidurans]UBM08438.1 enoyl-CoA hydratase/isomerase family protein [Cupriavidus metallidurans]